MDRTLRVIVETLRCSKTTEAGEDEVYMPVGAVNSATGRTSFVAPGSDSHWDMNDSGEKQERNINFVVHSGALPDGSTTDLNVLIMERDGGSPTQAIQVASGIAGALGAGNPVVVAGATIVGLLARLLPTDTDDWLGGFALRATNVGGQVSFAWQAGERARFMTRREIRGVLSGLPDLPTLRPVRDLFEAISQRATDSPNDPRQLFACEGDGSSYLVFVRAEAS